MRYLGGGLAHSLFLLLGVSLLSFALLELAPGDFFDEMRLNPQISPETVAALRARYGARPAAGRALPPLAAIGGRGGEMGYSFAYASPVGPLLRDRALHTLALAGVGDALRVADRDPARCLVRARAQGRWPDRLWGALDLGASRDARPARRARAAAARRPHGCLSDRRHDLARLRRASARGGSCRDLAPHAVLPVTALVLGMLPALVRHVRASMIEALAAPFMRAARAHGIPRRRLLFRHALRAAAQSARVALRLLARRRSSACRCWSRWS